jgi:NAD(P)-dependent dehydrogenase (short-subunit alcohol dehydrogenase family)
VSRSRDIEGTVVAITGGGRGIGLAAARALAARGAKVALGDLDLPAAERAAAELGPPAWAARMDVTDRASFEGFLRDAEAALGPVEVLVNNAGIMHLGVLEEEPDALTERQIAVNLGGVINGVKVALPVMRRRGRGHLVNVASTLGKSALPGAATYSATKHAIVGLTEALRGELRGTGVDVSLVLPHAVATELASGFALGSRALRPIAPERVAGAIVRAIRHPGTDVWVPAWHRQAYFLRGLPPRSARGILERRVLRSDRMFLDADAALRAGYEERIAKGIDA